MKEVRVEVEVNVYAAEDDGVERMTLRRELVVTEEDAARDRETPALGPPGDEAVVMLDAICSDIPDDVERFVRTRVNGL